MRLRTRSNQPDCRDQFLRATVLAPADDQPLDHAILSWPGDEVLGPESHRHYGDEEAEEDLESLEAVVVLGSVQQSRLSSQFAFRHFNWQIEMQIGTQMRKTVIPMFETHFEHLKIED